MNPSVLQRIADGDLAAVKECISQYSGIVWSLARRLSRTAADAEDATQEIFLNLWRSASSFDPVKGSEIAFIATLARRRLIDRRRKWRSELPIDASADISEVVSRSDPGTAAQISEEAEAALKALQQLRPEQRHMLELGLVDGLSQSEISARLGIPLGTVKSHMRRGLIQMREYILNPTERIPTSDHGRP